MRLAPVLTRSCAGAVTVLLAAGLLSAPTVAEPRPAPTRDTGLSRHVDPLIGSANGGNTYPGAVRPFGMLSWSPTTTRGDQTDTGAANGYAYDATRVRGFSLTHVNGAGCAPGAAGDVPIMPFVGDVTSSPTADSSDEVYASDFSHDDETAEAGRYRVGLANGATADLTATTRTGVGEFTFPRGKAANLLFRTSNSLNGSEDADIRIDARTRTVTGSVLTGGFCGRRATGNGSNRVSYYRLHFVATFDRAFSQVGTWEDDRLMPGATTSSGGEGYLTGADRRGRGSGGWVGFDTRRDGDVGMRVGISYTSLAGARKNLAAETTRRSTVDGVARDARRAWDRALASIEVDGGDPDRRTAFYTALYHAYLQPNISNDVDGRYLGADQEVHRLPRGQRAQYGNFSGWDQYRAHTQLLALLEPQVAGDFAQSLFNLARQNGGVWDRWVHVNGPTHVMTGDPSAPTLAGFHALGVRNFDVEGAFDSLVRQATVPNPAGLSESGCPGQCVGQRPNLAEYLRLHYAPQDDCRCWGGAAE
ncbi:GH92 family glycosyl hydrolase, partial [Solicola sp. PLA-1-18]|uniref:GH92 family glycosyl hydrolase n=1 Tax=Solicola sp. PLA-1-18 TaxID=3380532 RepID=UPI003B815A4C